MKKKISRGGWVGIGNGIGLGVRLDGRGYMSCVDFISIGGRGGVIGCFCF